jgi:hypothetical protein
MLQYTWENRKIQCPELLHDLFRNRPELNIQF